MIKSLLLAVDGSAYTEAVLSYGEFLANAFNADLRIVSIVDVRFYEWVVHTGGESYMPVIPSSLFQDESQKFLSERADAVLKNANQRFKGSNLKFECERIEGSPAESICDLSRQVDMVIMGTRGDYARWADKMLGSTLEPVSRQCSSPLLIVETKYFPFKSILCAYDATEYSNRALKLAVNMAEQMDVELEVMNVNDDNDRREQVLGEARKYCEHYAIDVQFRHETGNAAEVIAEASHNTADPALLVMGAYGHSKIREAILGSVTVQVMRSAAKPILLAR